MFEKILIANRGEIALRVQRACREMGIKTVVVYSQADKEAKYVKLADEAVCIGPPDPARSYLNIPAIISAAEVTNSQAIHPGYGFLSENANFAEQVEQSGFVFIGPSSQTIRLMGDKIRAKEIMSNLGMSVLESSGKIGDDFLDVAEKVGYPLMIKSAGGGGGRGMRVLRSSENLLTELEKTKSEAGLLFSNSSVYFEKYLENPRHIEVQVICDSSGNSIVLGQRDCSIQRRNQKLIEEAPVLGVGSILIERLNSLCLKACKEICYRGVGTFEFLFDGQNFYFMEMNTRVQVEHPVTEVLVDLDLIQEQIKVAAGIPLSFNQGDVESRGHAIECRINAEDSFSFTPSPGLILSYHQPGGPGVRIDSHIYDGYVIPPFYDSMIAKVITHAATRLQAIEKMKLALSEMMIDGVESNLSLLNSILNDRVFCDADGLGIHYLENNLERLKNLEL